ncbi:alpha/beta fold hydrolase [Methylobrevis albus]|uniref:Alpha/beta fold hydrolase n=1 Tax=Methylobrevis albus TaxID=2793297 RepID=A0A931MX93_9HYPH|nr:alpha/beta fold hydrolase [Methylobrevis albus]MBH0238658.1 alpha/beta fold hydrolase [Methylobrevis albus]
MTSTTTTVRSGDADLFVRIDGDAGLPAIILGNSLAADHRMWDDQIPMLTRSRRVVRYDTRGHGQSTAPEGPYSFPMLVADMIAVLDALDIDRADVMGLSLGGMTALGVGLEHPGRVGRLICADARADNPPPFVAFWDQRIAAIREGGIEAILAGTLDRWFTVTEREKRPDLAERSSAMILATSPDGYIACAEALKGLDYLRRLPQMQPETLFIVGSEDMGAPPDAMRAMAAATPGSRFVVLPGSAHIANMEDPAGFDAAIAEFLDAGRAAAE